jgi:4-amino-4-deoxy-L-arabinose transferase-like glycosyltransferase
MARGLRLTAPGGPAAGVAALLLLALVLRVGVVLATPDVDATHDGADYVHHAAAIAAGDGYPDSGIAPGGQPSAYRPPAWPYLLGGVFALTGADVTAGRMTQMLVGVAGVALAGLVAFQLWGTTVALLTLALAAVYPPLVIGSSGLLTEPLFVALELAALAAILRYRSSRRWGWAAAAGGLAGLAILTRTNGAVLLLPLALGAWGRPVLSPRSLRAPALVLACAGLAVAPWTIRNAIELDEFVPVATQGGITLAGTYNDTSRTDPRFPAAWRPPNLDAAYAELIARTRGRGEPAVNDALGDAAREYALERPGYMAEVAWRNLLRALGLGGSDFNRQATAFELDLGPRWSDVMTYGFVPFALLAVAGCFTAAARRTPPWVWAIPVLMIAAIVLVSASQRFRAPADPFVVMLAALALSAALRLRRDSPEDRQPALRRPLPGHRLGPRAARRS